MAPRNARRLRNDQVRVARPHAADEAIAIDDNVVVRFQDADAQVARGLVNKSAALAKVGRDRETLTACDFIVARFSTATDIRLKEAVANALLNKGEIAHELGRDDDAAAAYNEVVARFHDDPESVLPERVAQAQRALAALRPPP